MNFNLNPYEKYILLNCLYLASSIMQKKIEITISECSPIRGFYIEKDDEIINEINEAKKLYISLLKNLTLSNLYQKEYTKSEFEKINQKFIDYNINAKIRSLFKFITLNQFQTEKEKIKCYQSLNLSEIQLTKIDCAEINESIKKTIKEIDFKNKIMSKEEVKSMSYLIWKTKENSANLLSVDHLKYILDNKNISHYLYLYELENFLNITGVNRISHLCFPVEYQDVAKLNYFNKGDYQGFDEIFLLDDPIYQKYKNFVRKIKEDKENNKNKNADKFHDILLSQTW